MEFKTLAKFDDELTDYFVDKLYLWFHTTRMDASFEGTSNERDEAIEIIQREMLVKCSATVAVKNATAAFMSLPFFQGLIKNCTATELAGFKQQLRLYLNMFLPKAGYEVASTIRYTGKMEGCILATKNWEAGEKVGCCVGTIATLTQEEDQALRNEGRDFSVMVSTRFKNARLFLGPAKFMNHDCEANCRFVSQGNTVTFYTTKPIKCSEEMTVFYGDHYFGENNCECRCVSCQSNQRGYYAPAPTPTLTLYTSGSSDYIEPLTPVEETTSRRRSSRKRKAIDYSDNYVTGIHIVNQTNAKKTKTTTSNVQQSLSKTKQAKRPTHAAPKPRHKPIHPEMELSFICHGTENWLYMPVVDDPAKYTSCKRKCSFIEAELSSYKKVCNYLDRDTQEHVLVPDPPLFPSACKSSPNVATQESILDFTSSVATGAEQQFDQWIDEQSDLSSVGTVSDEDDAVDCCQQADKFVNGTVPGQRAVCGRCHRHKMIFGLRWPLRR